MRSPHRLLPLAALALLPACSMNWGGGIKSERTEEVSFTAEGAEAIRVESINGRIELVAGEVAEPTGSTKYYARASTQEEADARVAEMGWSTAVEGGVLVLKVEPPKDSRSNCGANLVLTVPAGWNVEANTSNGGVLVKGDFPRSLVDTSNGSVKVESDGTVRVKTSNGRIEYLGDSDDFELRTSNGKVEVDLAGDWDGRGTINTSNGSVRVRCEGQLDAVVDADTSNGKIRVEGPEMGDGGRLRVDTSNGSVTVTHTGSKMSTEPAETQG